MFETFELQYLNKLIESKIRDFTSPKPFHTVKVQRFGRNEVKPSAKVGGKFPMPVSALVADFAIEFASALTARHQLLEPLTLRDTALLSFRSAFKDCFKNCGLCPFSPVLSVKKVFNPKSIPTLLPVADKTSLLVSSVII